MSTDTDREPEMTHLSIRIPQALMDEIDEVWRDRGYASKSEFVRDALRTGVDPPVRLSEDTLDALARSREQRERGETVSADAVREHLGLDDGAE